MRFSILCRLTIWIIWALPPAYRTGWPKSTVLAAIRAWAEYTDEAREALENHDGQRLGTLMNANFDLRRRLYGDECIGARNLQMIQTARKLGLPAKFTGSGGAVMGICEDHVQFEKAKQTFEDLQCSLTTLLPTSGEPHSVEVDP